ncbi:MAG: cupin domain-containing protein [Chloroflexota bacterium]|nr:cupin domain-containing protein [Chloroflexota bacterium]
MSQVYVDEGMLPLCGFGLTGSFESCQRERRRVVNPLQKDSVIETSAESGGVRTLIEIDVAPGGGTIPHYHTSCDEHFEVLHGSLDVMVGGSVCTLRPGDKAIAPRNTLHNFRNSTSAQTTFLVELRPGSEGFERALIAGYGLARDCLVRANGIPRNLLHLAVLLEWSEIRMPEIVAVFAPVFRLLAKQGRCMGVDRDLEARYSW